MLAVSLAFLLPASWAQELTREELYILANAKRGIYLSFEDFFENTPIPLSHTDNGYGFAHENYLYSLKKEQIIRYHDEFGVLRTVPASTIWGYCTGDNFFVSMGVGYAKILVIGSISYFVADVLVELPAVATATGGGGAGFAATPRYSYEKQPFILNVADGRIFPAEPAKLALFLEQDSALHADYMAFKPKMRRKQLIPTITEFNLAHPFSFSK